MTLSTRPLYWLANLTKHPLMVPVCLLAITLIGAFFRLYKLGDWSFWGDEMFTISREEDGFNYDLFRQSLSLLLIQTVTALKGITEWNARIVPAIIGILTIPVLFFLIRKFFDVPTALLAALLLALSPWHLYWSQNARFYTALLLFYSLAIFFFHLGLEQDRPRYLFLCLLFLGLAAKERLLALFFVPVILVYICLLHLLSFERPKGWRFRNAAIFIAPGLLGILLFAGPYLRNLSGWMEGFGFANNNPFWLAGGFAFYVGLPVICLSLLGGAYLILQKSRVGLLLAVNAVLPISLLVIIAPFHYTANRYAFVSLTSFLILSAVCVTTLIKRSNWPVNLLGLGTLLISLITPLGENVLYYQYQNGNRDDWKAAFAYVEQHRRPGDVVVSANRQLAKYYLSEDSIPFARLSLVDVEGQEHRVWFVEDMASLQKYPEVHEWLVHKARLVSVHDVTFQARNFSMRVYIYDPVRGFTRERAEDAE